MNKPIISVIVPIYNVEKQLARCLDSILCQTFSNIEIICVNDGSRDGSRKILAQYAERDSRIRIVDKKNGGLSSARNAGMAVATGEFYSFVDSDDKIAPDMLEKMYKSMTSLNTDITICAVRRIDETTGRVDDSDPYYTLENFDKSFDNRAFSYKDTKPFIMDVCVMAWNKLYRKSFVDACQAKYPEGYIFEDGPFFFSLFFKTERVSIVREFLYFYYINRKGSIIQKGGRKFLDLIDVIEMMYNSIKVIPDFEDVKYIFFMKKVGDIMFRYEHLGLMYKYLYAQKIKKNCSLANETLFPPSMVKGAFGYVYCLFAYLKTGNILLYFWKKLRMKFKFKIIEILYFDKDYYLLQYKRKPLIKIKKETDLFAVYYYDDKIHISIHGKQKLKIPFNYSELEKLTKDE